MGVMKGFENGVTQKDCFADIHNRYDEYSGHGWCHTISNAMIVAASLLYGKGDYGKSICLANETGFDTDCNGATVGSIVGAIAGYKNFGGTLAAQLNDRVRPDVFGFRDTSMRELAERTLKVWQS